MRIVRWLGCTLLPLFALMPGCRTADVKHPIYVSNFELQPGNLKHTEGVMDQIKIPASLGSALKPLQQILSGADDPQKRAQELVDLMANSLVDDLRKAGFTAERLQPGAPLPAQGWWLRGVFTEVQEGNRFQRSLIGFGQGATDVQLIAVMSDLAKRPPTPLYDVTAAAKSGKAPGAVVFGPWGAATRFILAGDDLDKNIKQTASKITEDVVRHAKSQKP